MERETGREYYFVSAGLMDILCTIWHVFADFSVCVLGLLIAMWDLFINSSWWNNFNPALLQNVFIVSTGIFIPYVLNMLKPLETNNTKKKEFEKNLIIDQKIHLLIFGFIAVLAIYFLSFFDVNDITISNYRKLYALIVSIAFFIALGRYIMRFFDFDVNRNTLKFNLEYLKKTEDLSKIMVAYEAIFSEKISLESEKKYTGKFVKKVDELIKKDIKSVIYLSEIYLSNIKKRNANIILKIVLPKVLEWGNIVFKRIDSEGRGWVKYSFFTEQFFTEIFKKLFLNNRYMEFRKIFEKYVNKLEDSDYKKDLLRIFLTIAYDNFDKLENKYTAWGSRYGFFPKEWRITKGNLEGDKKYIVEHIFKIFKEYVISPTLQEGVEEGEYKHKVDEFIKGLFSEVEIMLFSEIIISLTSDSQYYVENRWNFGRIGRFSTIHGSMSKEKMEELRRQKEEREEKKALELIPILFSEYITKKRLIEIIENLKNIRKKYKKDSREKMRASILLEAIKKLQEYLKNNPIV